MPSAVALPIVNRNNTSELSSELLPIKPVNPKLQSLRNEDRPPSPKEPSPSLPRVPETHQLLGRFDMASTLRASKI